MACSQTLAGLCRSCEPSKGGIVEVYIANAADVTAALGEGKITGVTIASGASFHKYEFRRNTGSMTSTLNVDAAAGTSYVTTELILQFNKMDTQKRIEIAALSLGDLVIIVKDANGLFWYLGYDVPVNASAGTGQTGQNAGDGNFYQITLADESASYPYEVLDSVVEGLSATCA